MRRRTTHIDVKAVVDGTLEEIWLEVLHDGLGEPVHLPVIVAKGLRPGPLVGITAAVHGNEVNGAPAIHRLLKSLDLRKLKGAVIACPVVNVPAYLLHQRRTDDGSDLNHLFPGKPQGREAEVLAHRVFERLVRRVDILLDLHTASFGRVNSLYVRADMKSEATARMAYLQRPDIIVHNPASDGTLRGAATAEEIPAITVEIGNPGRLQRELIARTVAGLRANLADQRMIPRRRGRRINPVVCSKSEWLRTDHGGLLDVLPDLRAMVLKGEVVARLYDVFGHVVREFTAPHDGIVIGKNVDPVTDTGARILHLGRVARPSSTLLRFAHLVDEPEEAS